MHQRPVGRQDAHTGVRQQVQTERAQSLQEALRPLQSHLLPAFGQHDVQTLQHDRRVLVRSSCSPSNTVISIQNNCVKN